MISKSYPSLQNLNGPSLEDPGGLFPRIHGCGWPVYVSGAPVMFHYPAGATLTHEREVFTRQGQSFISRISKSRDSSTCFKIQFFKNALKDRNRSGKKHTFDPVVNLFHLFAA